MGKDNVPFHTVIFPGSQIGSQDPWTKLHCLSTTEYLNYENGKFSKSRGIGVFGNSAKDTKVPADVWRYYLMKIRPETGDSEFLWQQFVDLANGELLAKLGNFVNRVIKLVNKVYPDGIPDYTALYGETTFVQAKEEINALLKQYIAEMESVSLRAGLAAAMEIAQAGNNFLQTNRFDNKLAASDPTKAAAVTGFAINLILLCASVFAPYLPATSRSILGQLNAPFLIIPDHWTADDIKPGHTIGKAKHLFSIIPAEKEKEWREQFGGTQAERQKIQSEAEEKAAKKAADKAKRAEKKKAKKTDEEKRSVETQGTQPIDDGKDAVDKVVDGVQQVTLPTS